MKIYATTLFMFLLELRQVRCLCVELIIEIHNKSEPVVIHNKPNCTWNDDLFEAEGLTSLHNAVLKQDFNDVFCLLVKGVDVNIADHKGDTPLHYAVKNSESEEIVKLLLMNGADVEARGARNRTPIHVATIYKQPEVLRLLLLCHPKSINARDSDGMTPLIIAASNVFADIVSFLPENGGDHNLPDLYYLTPLHDAVLRENMDVINDLMGKGANINATYYAFDSGWYENLIELLLEHEASASVADPNGWTPLHHVAMLLTSSAKYTVSLLLEHGAPIDAKTTSGCTALHIAAQYGEPSMVVLLSQSGADMESIDKNGFTPLHHATQRDDEVEEVVSILLVYGAPIEAPSTSGCTALHIAAQYGEPSTVSVLLQNGADIESTDKNGFTPLLHAVQREDKVEEVVKILLEKGADFNVTDQSNSTPLHLASKLGYDKIVDHLLRLGANPNASNIYQKTPVQEALSSYQLDVLKIYMNHGIGINLRSDYMSNLLHVAIKRNRLDVVEALHNVSVAKNSRFDGCTILHLVAQISNPIAMEHLIKKGANVNALDDWNRSPLYFPTVNRDVEVVEILLRYGSDVNAIDNSGRTPLHYSMYPSYNKIVRLLLKYHADVNIEPDLTNHWKIELVKYTKILSYMDLLKHLYRDNAKIKDREKALSPIAYAVWENRKDLLQLMIDARGKTALNPKDAEWPPLHVACFLGQDDMIKFLVDAGADLSLMDRFGMTCLHKAVMTEYVGTVRSIIELNADVNAEGFLGLTPLHVAAKFQNKRILKLLMAKGADVDKEDMAGFTPLLYAKIGGHPLFEELLVEKSFILNSTNRYKYLIKLSEVVADNVLIKYTNFHIKYYEWHTFKETYLNHLVVDASYNHEYLEFLLSVKERYDLDFISADELKNMTLSKLKPMRKRHHSLLRLVLNMTKDPDKQDKVMGWTALHWAAATGDLASVQLLVDGGARLSLQSMLSQTPMYLARYWGHMDVYRYLKSKGAVW